MLKMQKRKFFELELTNCYTHPDLNVQSVQVKYEHFKHLRVFG